jgi:HNH endonuclease
MTRKNSQIQLFKSKYKTRNGVVIDKDGYIKILNWKHPFHDNNGYVYLHRLIYEKYYGCIIMPWGKIDHKDNNNQNNSIENLELMSQSEHFSKHLTKDMSSRFCSNCKSKTTYFNKKRQYYIWNYFNKKLVCNDCFRKLKQNKCRYSF